MYVTSGFWITFISPHQLQEGGRAQRADAPIRAYNLPPRSLSLARHPFVSPLILDCRLSRPPSRPLFSRLYSSSFVRILTHTSVRFEYVSFLLFFPFYSNFFFFYAQINWFSNNSKSRNREEYFFHLRFLFVLSSLLISSRFIYACSFPSFLIFPAPRSSTSFLHLFYSNSTRVLCKKQASSTGVTLGDDDSVCTIPTDAITPTGRFISERCLGHDSKVFIGRFHPRILDKA